MRMYSTSSMSMYAFIVHHLLSLAILVYFAASAKGAIVTKSVSKVFQQSNIFGQPKTVNALSKLSLTIENGLCCVIGPSGSGKSTLAKCLTGREKISSGQVVYDMGWTNTSYIYLDHLYALTYDESRSCSYYFSDIVSKSPVITCLAEALELSEMFNKRIGSLMENERHAFEILLHASRQQDLHNVLLIVFDEYLDKKASSSRRKLVQQLNKICLSSELNIMVLILTHSKGVLRDCAADTIILKNGRVFDRNRDHTRLVFPAQLSLIDWLRQQLISWPLQLPRLSIRVRFSNLETVWQSVQKRKIIWLPWPASIDQNTTDQTFQSMDFFHTSHECMIL